SNRYSSDTGRSCRRSFSFSVFSEGLRPMGLLVCSSVPSYWLSCSRRFTSMRKNIKRNDLSAQRPKRVHEGKKGKTKAIPPSCCSHERRDESERSYTRAVLISIHAGQF